MTFGQENPGLPTRRWTERFDGRAASRRLTSNALLSLSFFHKYSGECEGQRPSPVATRETRRNRPSWKDRPGDVSIAISCKRMFFQHRRFQAFVEDVSVNFGGRDVRVTQKHLDRPKIGPAGQKMGGKSAAPAAPTAAKSKSPPRFTQADPCTSKRPFFSR